MSEERNKIKILWVGDGAAPTGFATVNHSIIEKLDKEKYEVHHLAINYRGDPHPFSHAMYPAAMPTAMGADVWGFSRLINLIQVIKPNIIFLLNDPWVIQTYLASIIEAKGAVKNIEKIPVVVYFPVDATEHDGEWFRDYNELVKRVCVYTEFGKKVILETGIINPAMVEVIPHGVDLDVFHPLEDVVVNKKIVKTAQLIAKEAVYPINVKPEFLNSFVVLNANRNQPRKRIDITIRAFKEFAKDKPKNVKLYLHMGTRDVGWDIVRLALRYGMDDRLVITANTPGLPHIPADRLNLIYNACDVGINTSLGEGWGLTSWEHAATGKPQILPKHSALPEIWGDSAIWVPTIADYQYEGTHTIGRITSLEDTVKALEFAYNDWLNGSKVLNELSKKCLEIVRRPEYRWENIAKRFESIFEEVNDNVAE